jgi:hypothetical protein
LAGISSNVELGATGFIDLATNGAERVRIDTSGNLGVGTTSPAARFAVTGGTTIAAIADWNTKANAVFSLANASVRFGIGYTAADQVELQAFDTSNSARNLIVNRYGGDVGVGGDPVASISGVNSRLMATGSGAQGVVAYDNGTGNNQRIGMFADSTANLSGFDNNYSSTTNGMAFRINASEKMRIDSSGNFLVGTWRRRSVVEGL